MIKILRFIFTGSWHDHEWEIISEGSLIFQGKVYGRYFNQKCKCCGKLKFVKHNL